ncbi:MAG TPA: hypothetical protein VNI01_15275 [Elusimicrobiota bacterium]|jgi:hypothetical protein|nr:hypothetical protein [Elusimicrobiota bacterium]
MSANYCAECFWLRTGRASGGAVSYHCGLDREPLGSSVLGRPACAEFEQRDLEF